MGDEQHLGGGRLERDATLGADDGVAQVNAATDTVGPSQLLEALDDLDSGHGLTIDTAGNTPIETNDMACGRPRLREGVFGEHPRIVGDATLRGQRFLAADTDAPETAIDRVCGAVRRTGSCRAVRKSSSS